MNDFDYFVMFKPAERLEVNAKFYGTHNVAGELSGKTTVSAYYADDSLMFPVAVSKIVVPLDGNLYNAALEWFGSEEFYKGMEGRAFLNRDHIRNAIDFGDFNKDYEIKVKVGIVSNGSKNREFEAEIKNDKVRVGIPGGDYLKSCDTSKYFGNEPYTLSIQEMFDIAKDVVKEETRNF